VTPDDLSDFCDCYPREGEWLMLVKTGQVSQSAPQAIKARRLFEAFVRGLREVEAPEWDGVLARVAV
jgi:hypothetical protein